MVSTFTPNIQLEEPARGDDVGVWDTPVNSNMTLTDKVVGGIASISLNNSPVVLSAAQFQSKTITFSSTLTGNVTITFPTSFIKSWEIFNLCTGSSAFTVTLGTTNATGLVICAPPGEGIDIISDGQNLRYKNFGRIGSYWDYAGSSVPNWVSGCSIAPYLDCNGTTFSSASFPALAAILGSTTLPDFRGRSPHYANEGTGRLTSAGAGIDGNTLFAVGGTNGTLLSTSQVPTLTAVNAAQSITTSLPGVSRIPYSNNNDLLTFSAAGGGFGVSIYSAANNWAFSNSMTANNSISATYTNGSQQTVAVNAPGIVSGLRMIRAG